MDVRILSEEELRRVVGVDHSALDAVEAAFNYLQEGRLSMPPIMHISVPGHHGDIDVKSAYVPGLPNIAIKIASGFYDNPKLGLPAGSAMMVLLSAQTGFCEAVLLDNGYLTDLRTGLAGAVAARYLAPSALETVGVLGTGVQARYQVECLALVRDFAKVLVWGRSADKAEACARDLAARLDVDARVALSAGDVVAESQVVITATASKSPLLTADAIHDGLHITAVGADFPGKQELDPGILQRADTLACDSLSQCLANGEIQHLAVDGQLPVGLEAIELGALTSGLRKGRTTNGQFTVCDLTGTGVQDTAIANLALAAAAG